MVEWRLKGLTNNSHPWHLLCVRKYSNIQIFIYSYIPGALKFPSVERLNTSFVLNVRVEPYPAPHLLGIATLAAVAGACPRPVKGLPTPPGIPLEGPSGRGRARLDSFRGAAGDRARIGYSPRAATPAAPDWSTTSSATSSLETVLAESRTHGWRMRVSLRVCRCRAPSWVTRARACYGHAASANNWGGDSILRWLNGI